MKVIVPAHTYVLQNHDNPENGQTLTFIQKTPVSPGSTELMTVMDGTTNEEVLEALIDRIETLDRKAPCEENKKTLEGLVKALWWINERKQNREKRGVLGTLST